MSQVNLDALVGALVSSVAEAEHMLRQTQIRHLRGFFDANHHPISVEISMPRAGGGSDEPSHSLPLKVPLIALVNLSHISIAEMEIKFQTDLGDVSEKGQVTEDTAANGSEDASRHLEWQHQSHRAISASTGPSVGGSEKASVTLRVKQSETPEALARIVARLNLLF